MEKHKKMTIFRKEIKGYKRQGKHIFNWVRVLFIPLFVAFLMVLIFATSWSSSLSSGLVAYYKMDGCYGSATYCSGDNVLDSVTGIYNMTDIGDVSGSPQSGIGGIINGTRGTFGPADYFRISTLTNNPTNFENNSFSISLWTYKEMSSGIKTWGSIISNLDGTTGNATNQGFDFSENNATDWVLRLWDGMECTEASNIQISVNNTKGVWIHWVIVRDLNNVTIYVNSVVNQSRMINQSICNLTQVGDFFQIGYQHDLFEGYIDEVGIWNRSLSQSEITTLYNTGSGIAYYPMSINLISPTDYSNSSTGKIIFNASYSATNLSNATLYIWKGTTIYNNTEIKTISGSTNSSGWSISSFTLGDYYWNVKICENAPVSLCYFAGANKTFSRSPAFSTSVFNATTTSTSIETFSINVTYDSSLYGINVNFVYNNTIYSATITGSGDNKTLIRTITIPIATATTKSFYWNVSLTSGTTTYYSSNPETQTIGALLDLNIAQTCPSGFLPAINFSFFGETNQTSLNATTDYLIYYGLGSASSSYINATINNVHSFSVCINSTMTYYNLGYGELQYSVDGFTDRRFYLFNGTRITNTTTLYNLYSLENGLATSFLLKVKTTTLNPYVNHYVSLMRWYPEENSYKVVEMGKTDDKGESVLRVKIEDVDYRIGVYTNEGVLIKLLNPIRMVCLASPCTYTIFIEGIELNLVDYMGLQSNLSFDHTLKIFTYIWNDPSQAVQTLNLSVFKDTGTTSYVVCSTIGSGFTGVLICDVSAYTGILRAEVYRTASPTKVIARLIEEIRSRLTDIEGGKTTGLAIGIGLLIIFALIGVASPVVTIILTIIALIPLLLLGSINIMLFMAIGAIGGIILHFLRRTRG